jgi:hypothetical protein
MKNENKSRLAGQLKDTKYQLIESLSTDKNIPITEGVLMAHRLPLSPEQWAESFASIVESGTREFGKAPCMSLEEDKDVDGDGAELTATTGKHKRTVLGGYGKLVESGPQISVHILRSEILFIVDLLRNYQQPDSDFDANLSYWAPKPNPQTTLGGWL